MLDIQRVSRTVRATGIADYDADQVFLDTKQAREFAFEAINTAGGGLQNIATGIINIADSRARLHRHARYPAELGFEADHMRSIIKDRRRFCRLVHIGIYGDI